MVASTDGYAVRKTPATMLPLGSCWGADLVEPDFGTTHLFLTYSNSFVVARHTLLTNPSPAKPTVAG
jgi:hypothetical protein